MKYGMSPKVDMHFDMYSMARAKRKVVKKSPCLDPFCALDVLGGVQLIRIM